MPGLVAARSVAVLLLLVLVVSGCSRPERPPEFVPKDKMGNPIPLAEREREWHRNHFPDRTGIWHYELRYTGVNPDSPPGRPVHMFDVLAEYPKRTADTLIFDAGGPLPLPVGTVVECELPAEEVGFTSHGFVDFYSKRPAYEVFSRYVSRAP